MSKEDFKRNYEEEKLFQELKECPLRNSEYLKKKYQGLDIDHYRLYRRIVNYQIKMYGCQLCELSRIDYKTKEDYRRLAINARRRERYQKNRDYLTRKKRDSYHEV